MKKIILLINSLFIMLLIFSSNSFAAGNTGRVLNYISHGGVRYVSPYAPIQVQGTSGLSGVNVIFGNGTNNTGWSANLPGGGAFTCSLSPPSLPPNNNSGCYLYVKSYWGGLTLTDGPFTVGLPDTTAPQNPSVTCSGATNTLTVTLYLSATDNVGVTAYYAVESPTPPATPSGTAPSGWTAVTPSTNYAGSHSFNTTKNSGSKTVHVWFKDAQNNVSARASTTFTITDTISPNGNFTISQPAGSVSGFFSSPNLNMTLTASDIVSDVTHYYIRDGNSSTPTSDENGWQTFAPPPQQSYSSYNATHTLSAGDGAKSVYVWYKDAAGNVGAATGSPAAITLDTKAPIAGSGNSSSPIASLVAAVTYPYHIVVGSDKTIYYYSSVADYLHIWQYKNGSSSVYASIIFGYDQNPISSLAIDQNDNLYMCGMSHAYGGMPTQIITNTISNVIIAQNYWGAPFQHIFKIAVDSNGNVYVASGGIYKYTKTGSYTYSYAGIVSSGGDMAGDNNGNLFILSGYDIIKLKPDGSTETYYSGLPFSSTNITLDLNNNIYLSTTNKIFSLSSSKVLSVIAGDDLSGDNIGPGLQARFNNVSDLCTGHTGDLYVADYMNSKIKKISFENNDGLLINNGAKLTTKPELKMKIFGTDWHSGAQGSGVEKYCIKYNDSSAPAAYDSTAWLNLPTTFNNTSPATQEVDFILPATEPDGLKIFYLWFKDKAGNISSAAQKSIKYDTHPPVEAIAGSLSIVGAHPELLVTREVMLQLNAESGQDTVEGYYDIKVSHYFLADCSLGTTVTPPTSSSSWTAVTTPVTPYSEVVPYTVTSTGDGTKEIYVWYKDIAGNMSISSKCVTYLDTSIPHGSFTINSGAEWSNSPLVTLNLNALSATAVDGYFVSTSSTTPAATDVGWRPVSPAVSSYTADAPYSLNRIPGVKTVYVWYKSTSGIVSAVSSDTIKLDCEAPVPGFGKMKRITIAGSGEPGDADGPALSAKFNYPTGIVFDSKGNLYVADHNNNKIRKMDAAGNVTTFAGPPPGDTSEGSVDGPPQTARFKFPTDVKTDANDNIYVGAYRNTKVRKILPNGYVTTFAGSDTYGHLNGPISTALFTETFSTVFDQNGNMYVSDHGSWMIRKISAAGYVTTLAGSGTVGDRDGTGTGADLYNNNFINVDSAGNVYVSLGMSYYKIRKITPAGVSTVFAGPPSGATGSGSNDGFRTDARFAWPGQMIFDDAGNMFVADSSNGIRKISTSGMVTTIYKSPDFSTYNITWGKDGYIYASDQYVNKIYKIVPDTSGSVEINNGAQFVYTTAVKLNLAATDDYAGVTEYYAAESPEPPNASTTWNTLTLSGGKTDVNFNLSTVMAPVTVYVWFRDAAGNISQYSKKKVNPKMMRATAAIGSSAVFNKPFLISRDSVENLLVGDAAAAGSSPLFKLNAPLYNVGARIITPGGAIDKITNDISGLVLFADDHIGLIETAKKRFAVFNAAATFIGGFAKSVDIAANYHGYSALADIRGRIFDKYNAAGSVRPYAEAAAMAGQMTGFPLDLNFAASAIEMFTDSAYTTPVGKMVSAAAPVYLRVKGAGGDPNVINSIMAGAKSSDDPTGIAVQLVETSSSSDLFTGALTLGRHSNRAAGVLGAGPKNMIYLSVHSKTGILNGVMQTRPKQPSGPVYTVELGDGVFIEMVRIPAGKFVMGQVGITDATPTHEVTISKDFYMSKYEITQGQWLKVLGALASADKPLVSQSNTYNYGKGENYPVYYVSWNDICNSGGNDFMTKINAMGLVDGTFRLPTEAEWEYACRAGTTSTYYWGEDASEATVKQYCWYDKNAYSSTWTLPHAAVQGTQIVGQKLPNVFGLYDMSGNVFEWCSDWYGAYTSAAATDPAGPATGSVRPLRGDSWNSGVSGCRSAYRLAYTPTLRNHYIGFRLVLPAGQ